jgi:hypothetical protein
MSMFNIPNTPVTPGPWYQMWEKAQKEGFVVPYWERKAVQKLKKIRHPKQGYKEDRIPQVGKAKVIGMIGMDEKGKVIDINIPDAIPFFVVELTIGLHSSNWKEAIITNQLEYYWRWQPRDNEVIMGDLRLSLEDRKTINMAVKTFKKSFRQAPQGE